MSQRGRNKEPERKEQGVGGEEARCRRARSKESKGLEVQGGRL